MTKIIFEYGTMSSMKSASIIAKSTALVKQGKHVILMKPGVDTRDEGVISSRATETTYPAFLVGEDFEETKDYLAKEVVDNCFIFIDESQMLTKDIMKQLINELRYLGEFKQNITVMFYGLKNNFKNELFDSIKVLVAEADSVEELKATCHFCNRASTTHLLAINGRFVTEGQELNVEDDKTNYYSVCQSCRWNNLGREEYLNN